MNARAEISNLPLPTWVVNTCEVEPWKKTVASGTSGIDRTKSNGMSVLNAAWPVYLSWWLGNASWRTTCAERV